MLRINCGLGYLYIIVLRKQYSPILKPPSLHLTNHAVVALFLYTSCIVGYSSAYASLTGRFHFVKSAPRPTDVLGAFVSYLKYYLHSIRCLEYMLQPFTSSDPNFYLSLHAQSSCVLSVASELSSSEDLHFDFVEMYSRLGRSAMPLGSSKNIQASLALLSLLYIF